MGAGEKEYRGPAQIEVPPQHDGDVVQAEKGLNSEQEEDLISQ